MPDSGRARRGGGVPGVYYPALLYPGPVLPCPGTTLLYTVSAVHSAGLVVYTAQCVLDAVLGSYPLLGLVLLTE